VCVFVVEGPSSAVDVGGTHIFGRFGENGTQWLAYEMQVRTPQATAMVLPLPVSSRAANAVRFVNLEDYPELFDDLTRAIHVWDETWPKTLGGGGGPQPARLPVHQVGAYEASFAPTRADLERLDARFRLPSDLWAAVPDYADWGFVVFRLRPNAKLERVHAMAFEFATRSAEALFFPTVHVHDGSWQALAHFDHVLYFQGEDLAVPAHRWFVDGIEAPRPARREYETEDMWARTWWWDLAEDHCGYGGKLPGGSTAGRWKPADYGVLDGGRPVIAVERSLGLVAGGSPIRALGLSGLLANRDTWIHRGAGDATPLQRARTPDERYRAARARLGEDD